MQPATWGWNWCMDESAPSTQKNPSVGSPRYVCVVIRRGGFYCFIFCSFRLFGFLAFHGFVRMRLTVGCHMGHILGAHNYLQLLQVHNFQHSLVLLLVSACFSCCCICICILNLRLVCVAIVSNCNLLLFRVHFVVGAWAMCACPPHATHNWRSLDAATELR